MAISVKVPTDLWQGDDEAVLTSWLTSDGSWVNEGTLLAEIMVAKSQFEITAPGSGKIKLLRSVEDVLAKGDEIASISQ